jgi:hypothetical protein
MTVSGSCDMRDVRTHRTPQSVAKLQRLSDTQRRQLSLTGDVKDRTWP